MKNFLAGNIQMIDRAENWERAVEIASSPLVEKNKIKQGYVDKMIENIKTLGPYIVIMPKVAMPHARPDENVMENSLSLLKINEGVDFSEKERVYLIFVLAATDSSSHIDIIEQLSDLLGDEEKMAELLNSSSIENIEKII